MVNRCLVPSCNPNYRSRNGSIAPKKTKIFRFPTNKEECAAWLDAIPLKRKIDEKKPFLCERHWPNSYATVTKKGKVKPRDPPSVWPDHEKILPPSCRPPPPPKQRPTKRASLAVRNMQPDELPSFLQQDRVTFQIIKERVSSGCDIFCCSTTAYVRTTTVSSYRLSLCRMEFRNCFYKSIKISTSQHFIWVSRSVKFVIIFRASLI